MLTHTNPHNIRDIKVVKDRYLYRLCTLCEEVKPISNFSQARRLKQFVYTHGRCKVCRAVQAKNTFDKKKEDAQLKLEVKSKTDTEEK